MSPIPETSQARAGAIIRLAVPVMLTRLGMLMFATVDTLMLGRLSAEELAYFAISVPPQVTVITVSYGLFSGTLVLIAQARGAGRLEEIGHVFKIASAMALVLSVVVGYFLFQGEALLLVLGQSAEIAHGGGRAIETFTIGLPAVLLSAVASTLLEAMGRPRVVLIAVIAGLVAKLGLNWWLLDAHGAAGANLATSIVRWGMYLALLAYIAGTPAIARLGVYTRVVRKRRITVDLLRLGLPSGLSQGLESSAFGAMTIFAGWLGAHALGSYQIALNLVAMAFMMAMGLSTATSVQVGMAYGAGNRAAAESAGWLGTGMVIVYTLVAGAVLLGFDRQIAGLYAGDPALAAAAAAAIVIAAFILLPDGIQGVLMGGLRGFGDVNWPSAMHLVSFWVVTVPLAHHLAFARDWGTHGLLWGLVAGLACASALLAARYAAVSRRPLV
ncbi:MAG: MATE family efflux transporter [Alphaproteobacteria bacterium]|nr:MATE family efflux transporter [Alphaproteobacteria bacterium]